MMGEQTKWGNYQAHYEKQRVGYAVRIWNGIGYDEHTVDGELVALREVKTAMERLYDFHWLPDREYIRVKHELVQRESEVLEYDSNLEA